MAEKLTHVTKTGNVRTIELSPEVAHRARIGNRANHDFRFNRLTVIRIAALSAVALAVVATAMHLNHEQLEDIRSEQAK